MAGITSCATARGSVMGWKGLRGLLWFSTGGVTRSDATGTVRAALLCLWVGSPADTLWIPDPPRTMPSVTSPKGVRRCLPGKPSQGANTDRGSETEGVPALGGPKPWAFSLLVDLAGV